MRREAPQVFGDVSVSNETDRTRKIKPVVAHNDGELLLFLLIFSFFYS